MSLRQGNIDDVIEILKRDQERDFYNGVVITAKVRKGKSRLAHYIISKIYPQWTYEQNYIGNPKHGETFRKLFKAPHKSTCWVDEAAKVLATENRFEKAQSFLARLFEQFASHNKIILFCTPSFVLIDPRWRRDHITLWIHIFARGKAVLLKNRDIQSTLDVWGLDAMKEKEMSRRADELSDERILQNFDANPCALFYFTFPDWDTPEQKEEYLKHKTASQEDLMVEFDAWDKLQELNKTLPRAELGISRIATYLNMHYEIPIKEVALLSGYSEDWLRNKMDKFYDAVSENIITSEILPKKYFEEDFYQFIENRKNTRAKI